jgi:glycosyltransferase involved in cell wall biosynthesis
MGDTGLTVNAHDPVALSKALTTLVELGQSGRDSLGRQARARILHSYSLPSIIEQYASLYQSSVR